MKKNWKKTCGKTAGSWSFLAFFEDTTYAKILLRTLEYKWRTAQEYREHEFSFNSCNRQTKCIQTNVCLKQGKHQHMCYVWSYLYVQHLRNVNAQKIRTTLLSVVFDRSWAKVLYRFCFTGKRFSYVYVKLIPLSDTSPLAQVSVLL